MAGAAVAAIVSDVVSAAVVDTVTWGLVDAGLFMGSEMVVGAAISSGIGMLAGGLARQAVSSAMAPSQAASTVTSARAQGILINAPSNVDPIPVIYGSRTVGGTRVFMQVSGSSNEYLNMVIVLGEGPISAINTVYLDGTPSTDPQFSGLVTINKYLGTPTQAADSMLMASCPGVWTSAHTLSGVAYLAVQLKYDGNVFHSLPTITADVDGRTLYDPRTGLTAFSHNAALSIRDYLAHPIYGRGISGAAIDDASFIAAASTCDTLVSVPNGSGGTTTQAAYTCDGVLDVNQTAYDNMRGLLSSCRGMLVFSGGRYKLLIDKKAAAPQPTDFGFTESNITGSWTITLTGKNNKFNRVSAGFYNPAKNWQPDIAVYDNPALRASDNGLLLESKVDVPFTGNYYRAMQLAQMALQQSRFGIVCKFTALQEGLRCEVGDVVPITHSTPGWVAKRFMVLAIEVKDTHEVYITAREYDDSVYSLDTLTDEHLSAATTLPDPLKVAAPGVPSVTESLYATTQSTGVRTRATVSWAKTDAFAVSYQVEYQLIGATAWTVAAQVPNLTTDIDDLAPGIYNFRVKAINALGRSSIYSQASKEIVGLTAAPANVSGFTATASNGFALGKWSLSPDLDVRIGGRVDVRWTSLTAGAIWENGLPIAEFNGDAVTGVLPMLTGTYMAKFKDSTGNYSSAAAMWMLATGSITALPNSQTITESPVFTGSKSSLFVDGGSLQLGSATFIDSMTDNIDIWPNIDSIGGVATSGTYDASSVMDFGTVGTRRFIASILAQAFDTGDYIDARGLVDNWSSVDGNSINDATVTLLAAISNDGITYGPWFPMMAGDITCRAIKLRLQYQSASPTHNVGVSQFSVTANW